MAAAAVGLENANGLGRLVSRQLLSVGETVVDVPAKLSARVRALSGAGHKGKVHPEVSFAIMLGRPAEHPKSTWSGLSERLDALRDVGIIIDDIGAAGTRAGADDVLDAAVATWSAARLHRGEAISLPARPNPRRTRHGQSRFGHGPYDSAIHTRVAAGAGGCPMVER